MSTKKQSGIVAATIALATAVSAVLGLGHHPTVQKWDPRAAYETARTVDAAYRPALPGKHFLKARSLAKVIAFARPRLAEHRGKGYELAARGGEWSKPRSLKRSLVVLGAKLGSADPAPSNKPFKRGDVWRVKALKDGFILRVVAVDLNPTMYMNAGASEAVNIIIGTTVTRYPQVVGLGVHVCKCIAGTHPCIPSQHSYSGPGWAGNAVDWGAPSSWGWGSARSVALLDAVAAYQAHLRDLGYLPVAQILWRGVAHHYPGHIHDSGDPMMHGTPPCMRGNAADLTTDSEGS